MKKFYTLVLTVLSACSLTLSNAQTGPNLLGAKGTFSAPFITVNPKASSCTMSGADSYNPIGNIGNALNGCSTTGSSLPCSGYNYVYKSGGLEPEYTYSIIKNIGDANGGNCIKGDWRGQDHTGDGGYFMAVNGAPNGTFSDLFYQIKSIPVCPGTEYEFSAWVLNILPSSSQYAVRGTEPNISFNVITPAGTLTIANSGPIPYTKTPTWVKVGGTFTPSATTTSVDLQVINSTAVANGNDLGLDDISFNVVQSNIAVTGPTGTCDGNSLTVNYVVTDPTHTNSWYKWQRSVDGGATYADSTMGAQQGAFIGDSMKLLLDLKNVSATMNGYKYRLVVSTSVDGLANPVCTYLNEYTLIVNECGALPVTLSSFTGRYANGFSTLDWQTSQELNSDHFELYKSANGQDFSLVATAKAAGNSSVVRNYSYEDHSPNIGENVYYRLKEVDIDGKYILSSVVNLALGTSSSMVVYPNPFNSYVTVSFSANNTAPAILRLTNTSGQLVFTKAITINKGNNSILVNDIPQVIPGVYFLSISNAELHFNSKLQKQ